ncbi:hypothetical protein ACFO5R_13260 [Halosolutus amylolyticus]|uniref:Major facilitator superfamily (MFS) profile domain-containing protein n=1 Tax=Halosolutus amylolyticus TaxID=2932267 RepID=A0ABD5PQQ8_9EURY|nr:hypothetical protein [Halosolutus amylolyticus]
MDTETIVFGGLLGVQVVGSLVLVLGFFLQGVGSLVAVGGLLILASVVGLAFTATLVDEDDHTVHVPDRRGGLIPGLGRDSER